MTEYFFTSDLHGSEHRYARLFDAIRGRRPAAVFLGGDLLPGAISGFGSGLSGDEFVSAFLFDEFSKLRRDLDEYYPKIFLILGNDDGKYPEDSMLEGESDGLWYYMHNRVRSLGTFSVIGYSFVPPTPFRLKDWEKYDVSRFADPGSIHPTEGMRTVQVPENEIRYSTISEDLNTLTKGMDLSNTIMLFHSPPYRTSLDRAALDGIKVDHVPLDVHVGSIAIRRFIESRQPYVTLHGHVHESAELTGKWMDMLGSTYMFGGAHSGPELALVRFDPLVPSAAVRDIL
jgi:uncharacterized protein